MNLSYATILVFGGNYMRLYRELQLAYLVSDNKNPTNHPIYSVQEDFGSCMLHVNDDTIGILQVDKEHTIQPKMRDQDFLWNMYFDSSSCKEREGAGIVVIYSGGEIVSLMY